MRADAPWALVPAKPLGLAKSRLAPALSSSERQALARELLDQVVSVLGRSGALAGVALISRDPDVAALAWRHRAEVLSEPEAARLNEVIDTGLGQLSARGAARVLVIMGDLPYLTEADVRALVALDGPGRVVLAPDHHGVGTNALLLAPGAMRTCFGTANSFELHRARAAEAGLAVEVLRSKSLAHDLDTVEDLKQYQQAR